MKKKLIMIGVLVLGAMTVTACKDSKTKADETSTTEANETSTTEAVVITLSEDEAKKITDEWLVKIVKEVNANSLHGFEHNYVSSNKQLISDEFDMLSGYGQEKLATYEISVSVIDNENLQADITFGGDTLYTVHLIQKYGMWKCQLGD